MNEKFAKILEAVEATTEGMTDEDWKFRPEGKWGAPEVLEHLALTYSGTAKAFRKRILEGPQGGSPNLKQRVGHLLVLEMGVFPIKRKSPEPVAPKGEIGGKEALELLKRNLVEMDRAFADYKEKHGPAGKVATHPILGPLTYDQWPKFHLNHARHHMKQIKALRAAKGAS